MPVLLTVIPCARIMSLFHMKGAWNAEAAAFRAIRTPSTGFIPGEASVSVINLVNTNSKSRRYLRSLNPRRLDFILDLKLE
jgi:hypothetical protein